QVLGGGARGGPLRRWRSPRASGDSPFSRKTVFSPPSNRNLTAVPSSLPGSARYGQPHETEPQPTTVIAAPDLAAARVRAVAGARLRSASRRARSAAAPGVRTDRAR